MSVASKRSSDQDPISDQEQPRSPEQWAALGTLSLPADSPITEAERSWRHRAADALHGWSRHEQHEGSPMQLARVDYLAALTAVGTSVIRELDRDGKPGRVLSAEEAREVNGKRPTIARVEPHAAARSKHAPELSGIEA